MPSTQEIADLRQQLQPEPDCAEIRKLANEAVGFIEAVATFAKGLPGEQAHAWLVEHKIWSS